MRGAQAGMGRWVLVGAACLLVDPAMAAGVQDYLVQGYAVVRRTGVAGMFHGCEARQELTFGDGSVFVCSQKRTMLAYAPTVFVLARPGQPPSAVVIGGQAFPGWLSRIGEHAYPRPLSITSEAPRSEPAPMGGPQPQRIEGLQPRRSIGTELTYQNKPLNEAQQDEVPGARSGRASGGHR